MVEERGDAGVHEAVADVVAAAARAKDAAIHEALQQLDSPDHPPGVVIREFERGYRMGERLLRPARVIIAGPGSSGTSSGGGAEAGA